MPRRWLLISAMKPRAILRSCAIEPGTQIHKRRVARSAAALLSCFLSLSPGQSAFAQAPSAGETKSATPKTSAAIKQDIACPSQDFKKFIAVFSESELLQKAFTHFPLEYRYFEDTFKSDEQKTKMIGSYERLPFSDKRIFPNKLARKKEGLEIKIKQGKAGPNSIDLTLSVPDTDDVTIFQFRKTSGCWILYVIENQSP